ncbi:MAG: ABC transporter ATP-binding protein [Deltaproteobacteria bacterium]|nr:ABC transporter ATP-binding protein [Deltaproteobacteria bacterium]
MNDAAMNRQRHTLCLDGVSKRFRATKALDEVSFKVPEGSLTVILGSAGAGKTTTLRLIAGLDKPDAGRIELAGSDVAGWEPKDRNVAMIFDNLALYPDKTGFDNIASPLVIRGENREVIKGRVGEMARTLQITHIMKRLPKTMSGGERQRVALGRALIRTPNLFLLDEPLSSLDAKLRIELRAELRRMQREHGHTFLLATPDFHEAMGIADTIVMLREGRVVQIETPQTMYDQPADREVAEFIGAPRINLVAASHDPDTASLRFAGACVDLPVHLRRLLGLASAEFELGIRPEHLRLADPDSASIRAELIDVESLGPRSVITVRNEAAELRLLVDSLDTVSLELHSPVGVELAHAARFLAFDPATGRRMRPDA